MVRTPLVDRGTMAVFLSSSVHLFALKYANPKKSIPFACFSKHDPLPCFEVPFHRAL